jgi:predicted dehydrogenase
VLRLPMTPLRTAVVGCGLQGRLHAINLHANPEAEVIALCDREEARAGLLAAELGLPATAVHSDHRRLLERHRPQLLTVATMPDSHREIAVDALRAGADVLCEKPMAHTLSDAVQMAAVARQTGRTLTIGFNLRHSSAAQAVHAFIERGELGAPVCGRGSMLETQVPWWGPHQVKALSGGGAFAATAVHMIDLLMWLAGSPRPLTATASTARLYPAKRGATITEAARSRPYDVEDLAFGHVRFDSGFWLTVEGAWTWDVPGSECDFELVGERAQASVMPLSFWREDAGELRDVTAGTRGDLDEQSSIAAELGEVVASLRAGREPLVTVLQALEVQAVVDALYRSAESGREVDVADVRTSAEAAR